MSKDPIWQQRDNAQYNFQRFVLDTAVRSNNEHAGSGLGGSPSEFWFLMNHKIKVYASAPDKVSFNDSTENATIIANMPVDKGFPLSEIRKTFKKFFATHKDRIDITKEQENDLTFLKTLEIKYINAKMYLEALEMTHELALWLDTKIEFQKQIDTVFAKEKVFLQKKFLKELNLPQDYFEKLEDQKDKDTDNLNGGDPMNSIFESHPVWGAKYKLLNERHENCSKQLLSSEDNGKIKALNGYPLYIALQAVRSTVGIDRIVSLNLDENENWDILDRVNKVLDGR